MWYLSIHAWAILSPQVFKSSTAVKTQQTTIDVIEGLEKEFYIKAYPRSSRTNTITMKPTSTV